MNVYSHSHSYTFVFVNTVCHQSIRSFVYDRTSWIIWKCTVSCNQNINDCMNERDIYLYTYKYLHHFGADIAAVDSYVFEAVGEYDLMI